MKTACMRQQGRVLVPEVLMADRLATRLRGLIGWRCLPEGCGMLLQPCGAVHTLGMLFPLDVVYFDAGWRVIRAVKHLRPLRMSMGGFRARAALEIQSGWFDVSRLVPDVAVSFSA